ASARIRQNATRPRALIKLVSTMLLTMRSIRLRRSYVPTCCTTVKRSDTIRIELQRLYSTAASKRSPPSPFESFPGNGYHQHYIAQTAERPRHGRRPWHQNEVRPRKGSARVG